MKPIVRDFLTGTIAIGGVVGLIAMLGLTGELKDLGKRRYGFTITVDNAGGLSGTSPVLFNGVQIGTVSGVRPDPDPLKGVYLDLTIDERFRVPRSVEPQINQSFVGDVTLELALPENATPAQAADAIKKGETLPYRKSVTLISRLTEGVREPLEKLVAAAEGVRGFTDEYTTLGKNLNALVTPVSPTEADAGAAPTLNTVVARADRALAGADAWLSDAELRSDAKNLISGARARADEAGQAITGAAKTLDTQAMRIGDQVSALAESASRTLANVDQAAADLRVITGAITAGKGTAGQLVMNPDLYNNLNDAARRMDRALEEFRLLAEKYRTEGIPLKF